MTGEAACGKFNLRSLLVAASSNCSFGAMATAKSIPQKWAAAEAGIGAFKCMNTHLVIEL
jgi:hypothetical protein